MADDPRTPPGNPPPDSSKDVPAEGAPSLSPQAAAPEPVTPAAPAPAPAAPKPSAPAVPKPAVPAAAKPATPAAPRPAAPAAGHPPPAAAPPSGPPDPPPPAGTQPPAFITSLQQAVSGGVAALSYWVGDWTIIVPLARIQDVLHHLRHAPDASFDFLSDLTATDWPPRKAERFDVVYCLYSTEHRHRVRVKTMASETSPVPSATAIWPSANWLEREVFDMFGVNFVGHPDRRRILMPLDWQGYPQRKDYPLEGPGELLMENPIDWLKLRQAKDEAEIE